MTETTQSILNVDDYDPGRYARTRLMQQAGYSVREASTGKDALRIAKEENPSLILLDVNLPDMSGFEVCRQIRNNPPTASTIILHISASNVQTAHQVHGLDAGADSYLVEPVDPGVLVATVKAFLRTRRAEDELRRSNEELEWFAHRVAHDLTEPLRTITAHSELLELSFAERMTENEKQSMNFVLEGARRMDMLIAGLLRYAVAGHASAAPEVIDCELMLRQVIASMESTIRTADARITHSALPIIKADGGFGEVFQNLIANGIKYQRPGIPPEIHISAATEGDRWHFSVRDNGIGIAPENTKSIFNVFQRLHGRDIPGNGIGLALAHKVIKACGGTIWVESEVGLGSTFHFTVPL